MTDLAWLTERPIAHRGYHDMNNKIWENTLSAFKGSYEKGVRGSETDIRMTKDGELVILHDGTDSPAVLGGVPVGEKPAVHAHLALARR